MKLFTASQIREIDNATIEKEPIASIDLMERASMTLFEAFVERYEAGRRVFVFAGQGNNGGDALALARLLSQLKSNFKISVYVLESEHRSVDNKQNLDALLDILDVELKTLTSTIEFPVFDADDIVVDGLLGTGLSRSVDGLMGELINHINQSSCEVFSVDIPSGFFAESNMTNTGPVVEADYTVSFQFPKLSFLLSDSEICLSQWEVTDIGLHQASIEALESPYELLEDDTALTLVKQRPRFSHKGTFGHALLVAGKQGMMGAAVLSAKACVRSGVGLVSAHVPQSLGDIMQISVPEALLSTDRSELMFTDEIDVSAYSAIGVGPAIGTKPNAQQALLHLLKHCDKPLVLDADALNILALNKDWLNFLPNETVLTPHPGEFDRLTKKHDTAYDRLMSQIEMARKWQLVIVLKGAFTSIALPDGSCVFNSTGHSGLATGGSGDVLTGLITGLLAQGYVPEDAVKLGVWWHGKAADLYAENHNVPSLTASALIEYMSRVSF